MAHARPAGNDMAAHPHANTLQQNGAHPNTVQQNGPHPNTAQQNGRQQPKPNAAKPQKNSENGKHERETVQR
jgi:hypothetical protein